jgi:DNA-binding winged helix-turn-helix (wHTH) protein
VRYRFDRFELDLGAARLTRDGERIHLQPKVLDALEVLVASEGQIVAKETLLEKLWPGEIASEESLAQLIRKLRSALEDDAQAPRCLETVPKRGYRFIAVVSPVSAGEIPAEILPTPVAGAPSRQVEPTRPRSRRAAPRLIGLTALALGILGVAWIIKRPPPTLDSWSAQRLTASPERETAPALSPDGAFAAYSLNSVGEDQLDLYLLQIPGGSPQRLTRTPADEWRPSFSGDGKKLRFLRASSGPQAPDLIEMPVLGGVERRLAEGVVAAVWSPDESRLVLARRRAADAYELVEIVDERERLVERSHLPVDALAIAPDGRRWAFLRAGTIFVVDGEEPPQSLVGPISEARDLAWTANGEALLTDGRVGDRFGGLTRIRLADGALDLLHFNAIRLFHPSVSRQGTLLGVAEQKSRQLFRVDRHGTKPNALATPTTVEGFDVEHSGRYVAVTDWQPAPGRKTLALFDLETGAERALGDGLCPTFAPDARSIAFLGEREGRGGLFVSELESGATRRLADEASSVLFEEENLERCPAFAPDGRSLVWFGRESAERVGLRRLDLTTGRVEMLAAGTFGKPTFEATGHSLLVCAGGYQSRLERLEIASGRRSDLGLACPYRVPPVALADGGFALVEAIKSTPTLVEFSPAGQERRRFPLEVPRDAAFWGLFSLRPTDDGFVVLIERYEGDLYLVEPR